MPHDASRSRIVISTRCRGRSVARVTRMRSRAGAVKRPRASSSRAVRTERRRGRRREIPTARRPRRVVRDARARHFHIRMSSTRARAGTTRGTSIRRAGRPSSVGRPFVETRRESVEKKKRALVAYLARRTRAFARSRVRARRCAGQRPRAAPRFVGVGVGPSLRFIFLYVRVDTALKRV